MTKRAKPEELLGKRIRELRKKKGLTQEELGARAGISYKYLGSIERGLENPSFRHLTKIARALGVELGVEPVAKANHFYLRGHELLSEQVN